MPENAITEEEFQRSVHNYRTGDRARAVEDAADFRNRGVQDAVAVDFGRLGYGLMLRTAAESVGVVIVEEGPSNA
jgi:hypothetical protein